VPRELTETCSEARARSYEKEKIGHVALVCPNIDSTSCSHFTVRCTHIDTSFDNTSYGETLCIEVHNS
jgi:hypothetical protein